MLVNTSELVGTALDWAVAQCEGVVDYPNLKNGDWGWTSYAPSRKWEQGGPIVEREKIAIGFDDEFGWMGANMDGFYITGATPLEGAMRCYAISKLGAEIDIPEELL